MSDLNLGIAHISIEPESGSFQAQAEAQIKRALAPLKPGVNIQPNVSQAAITKSIAEIRAELNTLGNGNDVIINGNTAALSAKLAMLQAQAAGVNAAMNKGGNGNLLSQTDLAEAVNELGKMDGRLQQIKQDMADGGTTGTAAFHAIAQAVATAQSQLSDLKYNGVINADDIQQVANMDKALGTLESTLAQAGGSADDAGTRVGGLFSILGKISSASIPLFAKSMDDVSGSILPGFGDVLMEMMPHMLSYASGIHMMIEAAIEFTAVWVPAGVAVGAFALAAIPEIIEVTRQLDHMHQLMQATGASFAAFPASAGSLEAALKPQLLELYGIALQGIDSSTGSLGKGLDTVAMGVDNVAAKIVQWMSGSSGGGLDSFLKTGTQDAGMLADGFVQVGRILDTLLKSVPGYARLLLEFGDAFLTVLADVTQFVQPAIALFLKLHGAIFYLGLATTLVSAFGSSMLVAAAKATVLGTAMDAPTGMMGKMGAALGSMIGNFVNMIKYGTAYAVTLASIAKSEGLAAAGSDALSGLMEAIPFGPMGLAVGVAAAAIGGIFYLSLQHATTATTELINAQNKMIAASNYSNLQVDIANALENTAKQLQTNVANYNKYGNAQAAAAKSGNVLNSVAIENVNSLDQLSGQVGQASNAMMGYVTQLQTTTVRQNTLNQMFGGANAAAALFAAAGQNVNQISSDSASQFQALTIKLQGVATGYGLMSQQGGALGAQLDTLNISTSDATKSLSTLTSAETSWLTLVTGGVTDLSSFEGGMSSLQTAQSTLTTSMKTLTKAQSTYGTSNKTLKADQQAVVTNTLAQQSAFSSQITAAGTYLGSLQGLSSALNNTKTSQGEVTTAMKGTIAQMLPFAKGSQTNTAMLSNLAQLVGGPATSNYQTLAKWVGNTTSAQSNALTATDKLTTANDSLSTAAKNLATTLSADITQAQGMAIMQNGLTSATNNFAHAMSSQNGAMNQSVEIAGGTYYAALIKAGLSQSQATQQVDAFMKSQGYTQTAINSMNNYLDAQAKKLGTVENQAIAAKKAMQQYAGGSPYNASVNTTVGADGTVQVTGAGPGLNDVLAHISFRGQGFAGGGVVPGGSPGGDNHLAMVKSGELIIPSQHAARFGSMAKAAGIPGFAAGGVVSGSGGAAQAVQAVDNTDQSGMQSGAQQVMAQAVKTLTSYAKNQTENGTPVNYNATAGVAQWKSIVLQALAMNGLPASLLNQVLYQMQTESGGNPNAQNNTDSNAAAGDPSRGLLQTIGTTFAAYHIAGTSENIFNPLANVAAAINYAKHVYGPNLMNQYGGLGSGHGYSAGGVLPEKIMGVGVTSGNPYAFGSGEQVTPAGLIEDNNGLSGNMGLLIPILQANNKLLMKQNQILANQAPQYAGALNGAVGMGAQRAYFATGG